MVRVPPTAGWISQSIRVAAMEIPQGFVFGDGCAADANVPPGGINGKRYAGSEYQQCFAGAVCKMGRVTPAFDSGMPPGGKERSLHAFLVLRAFARVPAGAFFFDLL